MNELPENWHWKTVEELASDEPRSITDGPFGSKLKTAHYTEKGPRVIRLQNIGDGQFFDAKAHISEEHYQTLKNHRVDAGDIVIAAMGEDPPRACIVPEALGPAIVKADCIRFKPDPIHSTKFLEYALNSPGTRRRAKAIVHGVGRPRLNQGEIKAILLPVAPPGEQRRIVARIEELFSRIDAGVAALRQAKAQLQRYRQSVLAAAVTGQLTQAWREQHPDTEPVEQVIQRTQDLDSERKTRRGVPDVAPPPDWFHFQSMPDSWAIVSVAALLRAGVISDLKDGNHGSNHPKKADFTETGLPFVTAAEVNGFKIDYEGAYKIKGAPLEKLRVGFSKSRDVILTHKGSVGRVAVADRECVLTPQTTYYRCNEDCVIPEYLQYYFASPIFSRQLDEVKSQTTRDFVPISKQYFLSIILPPLSEQHQIVAEVEARTTAIDHLEAELDRQIIRSNRLRQSTLASAFRGAL